MSLTKCVDFQSEYEKMGNDYRIERSNLRESINDIFIRISEYIDLDHGYVSHVYSLIYNLHISVNGDNGRFDWGFLPAFRNAEPINEDLETSISTALSDTTILKSKFDQFPITYQAHTFHVFKCPNWIEKCFDSIIYKNYINALPAMEELLSNTYNLTSVMRLDLSDLTKHECFTTQLMQAYFQDVQTRVKLKCAELYNKATQNAFNDPSLVEVKENVDRVCKPFDVVHTWFDDQYICVLRPAGCEATFDLNIG